MRRENGLAIVVAGREIGFAGEDVDDATRADILKGAARTFDSESYAAGIAQIAADIAARRAARSSLQFQLLGVAGVLLMSGAYWMFRVRRRKAQRATNAAHVGVKELAKNLGPRCKTLGADLDYALLGEDDETRLALLQNHQMRVRESMSRSRRRIESAQTLSDWKGAQAELENVAREYSRARNVLRHLPEDFEADENAPHVVEVPPLGSDLAGARTGFALDFFTSQPVVRRKMVPVDLTVGTQRRRVWAARDTAARVLAGDTRIAVMDYGSAQRAWFDVPHFDPWKNEKRRAGNAAALGNRGVDERGKSAFGRRLYWLWARRTRLVRAPIISAGMAAREVSASTRNRRKNHRLINSHRTKTRRRMKKRWRRKRKARPQNAPSSRRKTQPKTAPRRAKPNRRSTLRENFQSFGEHGIRLGIYSQSTQKEPRASASGFQSPDSLPLRSLTRAVLRFASAIAAAEKLLRVLAAPHFFFAMNIREFAREIGVSPTTVSRSLSGRGRVGEKTRAMILARMAELDYVPHLPAQRLATRRSYMVALHFDAPTDAFFDLYAMEFVRGIHDALHARGYGLLLSGGAESLDRWTKSGAVDGVIAVAHDYENDSYARHVASLGVACVVIGTRDWSSEAGVGAVAIDLTSGARQVAQALWERGHRRIGFIGSPASQPVLDAFRGDLTRLGVKRRDLLIAKGGDKSEDGERAMRELLALPSPPTAVFARNDELAVGALRGARQLGVTVPRDVSLIGHDDLPIARLTEPPLTTVRVNCLEVGRAACETLFASLKTPQENRVAQSVRTELVLRETLASPRKSDLKIKVLPR